MADVKLLVLLEKSQRRNITQMAHELEGRGMTVERQMKLTGTIAGYAPSEAMEELRRINGIAELREDTTFEALKDDHEPGP